MEHCNPRNLDFCKSIVMLAQLDTSCKRLNVPNTISMRSLRRNVMPRNAREELNEIPGDLDFYKSIVMQA